MASEVSICNLALANLGDTATVASIDPPEGSAQAEHCAIFYPIARDALLEMHNWGFATKRAELAKLSLSPQGWLYAYSLPSDLVKVINVRLRGCYDSYGMKSPTPAYAVEVKSDGTKELLANDENLTIQYIYSVTDPNKFSPLFVSALAWHLASMLAGPLLKGDVGRAESKSCLQMMNLYLSQAKASDANQYRVSANYVPDSIKAR